jgi:hypothetical protein
VKETAALLALTATSLAAIALAAVSGWGFVSAASPREDSGALAEAPISHSNGVQVHASLCDRQTARISRDTIRPGRS